MGLSGGPGTAASEDVIEFLVGDKENHGALQEVPLRTGGSLLFDRRGEGSGEVAPLARIGVGWYVYVYLTPSEQRLLISGSQAAVTAAICAASAGAGAAGAAICAAASVVISEGANWLRNNGVCSGEMELRYSYSSVIAGRPILSGTKCI